MVNANNYLNKNINAMKVETTEMLRNPLVVVAVSAETIGNDEKLVMSFSGIEDTLVLNKTNTKVMIQAKGSDTDKWFGAQITLGLIPTTFNGNPTKSIMIVKVV